ncbi:hypothetical protein [Alkaliphilus oremlandii]|uniref:hypothetical protein n=1 Tax=Alkaliphilus oremlandii TaxID=461876 RepID=UPI0002EC7FF9|nr:hypothetical protein [Alkaliphilus oremlandii]
MNIITVEIDSLEKEHVFCAISNKKEKYRVFSKNGDLITKEILSDKKLIKLLEAKG